MEIKAYLVLRSDLDLQIEIYNSFFDLIFAGVVAAGARATMASARCRQRPDCCPSCVSGDALVNRCQRRSAGETLLGDLTSEGWLQCKPLSEKIDDLYYEPI